MLSFIDSLKDTIAHVHTTGGSAIEHLVPPEDLLQYLREYAIRQMATGNHPPHAFLEWFTENFFDEYIRVCFLHLSKLGIIEQARMYDLVCIVIDARLNDEPPSAKNQTFEEYLVFSLFETWDRLGDEQTRVYTFAKNRWLISWKHQEAKWYATNLGLFLLDLSPVQAATFLLSIDTIVNTGRRDLYHVSFQTLQDTFRPQPDSEYTPPLPYTHREILDQL